MINIVYIKSQNKNIKNTKPSNTKNSHSKLDFKVIHPNKKNIHNKDKNEPNQPAFLVPRDTSLIKTSYSKIRQTGLKYNKSLDFNINKPLVIDNENNIKELLKAKEEPF